ncbi:LAMI_0C06920g1_1 [Lachancea mirantina]|uniref:LAMI_0C06920g1_1 n=1 Tax=Lachancea mirantina TaxID=1230905 RepID=A0A1G4J3U5_9SACH|nr:LAMI_0C06920g1_1 [Lachancea mirantina]
MDHTIPINRIRAAFLKDSNDKEQMKRVLRPYLSSIHWSNKEFEVTYENEDYKTIMNEQQSPPITRDYLKDLKHISKPLYGRTESKGKFDVVGTRDVDKREANSREVDTREMISEAEPSKKDQLKDPETLKVDSVAPKSLDTMDPTKSASTTETNGRKHSLGKGKRKTSAFSRIFKTQSSDRKAGDRHDTSVQDRITRQAPMSFYDSAFNYDETMEDDDDDDDDDEDDGIKDGGSFFRDDAQQADDHYKQQQTRLIKRGAFAFNPQNILSNQDNKSSITENNSVSENHSGQASEDELKQDDLSDMESYMNEDDLKDLDLDGNATQFSSSNHQGGVVMDDNEGHRFPNSDGDDMSSYGKSLLDSDYSEEHFNEEMDKINSSSVVDDSLATEQLLQSESMPGHSIPKTQMLNALGKDGHTLSNVFKKDSFGLTSADARGPQWDRNVITGSLGCRGDTSSLSNVSDIVHKRNRSSLSGVNIGSSERLSPQSNQRHQRTISDSKDLAVVKKPGPETLEVTKREVNQQKATLISNLSTLFSTKKDNSQNFLECFAHVSGANAAPQDCIHLSIYIECSKTYKRSPFELNVRKEVSVFDVIGFILYVYSTSHKPDTDFKDDGINEDERSNPNKFNLKIVDEDGEPFEDNFGTLDRKKLIGTVSDDELVLCRVEDDDQYKANELVTPLPYEANRMGEHHGKSRRNSLKDSTLNQLSYYKPIIGATTDVSSSKHQKLVQIKVFLYPAVNPSVNFTNIQVPVTCKINDVLVQYCKMKSMDPNEYILKLHDQKVSCDLNCTVEELDGQNSLELVTKSQARKMNLKKFKRTLTSPGLPTIQSGELTPLTPDTRDNFMENTNPINLEERKGNYVDQNVNSRKPSSRLKLGLAKQMSSGSTGMGGGLLKLKNSSKTSLSNSTVPNGHSQSDHSGIDLMTDYRDLLAGAYYKYKVWRRQQMSFITKHERTLAIDGDYVYIIPPEHTYHWHHDSVKTKCFHISQLVLAKRSKRVAEYFKLFVSRPGGLKRYYFEAVNEQECAEIVSRLQKLSSAYRMNHQATTVPSVS